MKHEWKKHEKNLYGVKQSPRIVDIPMQQFIMIEGKGNPNDKDFSDKVSACKFRFIGSPIPLATDQSFRS